MDAAQSDIDLGEWILHLDGTVLEVFHESGVTHRWHVEFVAVQAKPRDDGALRLTLGIERFGVITEGARIGVPAERVAEVTEFFERARSRRARPRTDGLGA